MKRWTNAELEQISLDKFILTLIEERKAKCTNPNTPLYKKLVEAERLMSTIKAGPIRPLGSDKAGSKKVKTVVCTTERGLQCSTSDIVGASEIDFITYLDKMGDNPAKIVTSLNNQYNKKHPQAKIQSPWAVKNADRCVLQKKDPWGNIHFVYITWQ